MDTVALPGENSRDFPVRVTKTGGEEIDAEAARLGIEKADVFRLALKQYFERQGKSVDFTPEHGGKRKRMTEQQAIERVLERIRALGLPEPQVEYKLRFKTYDLAWPDRQVGIEVSQRKRPADTNDWTVGYIKPGANAAQIDEVLKKLPL